jgi:cobalt-zinc-cadmium efflux system outer membrane protein
MATFIAASVLAFSTATGPAEEAVNLDSLRLGANYLRWAPAKDDASVNSRSAGPTAAAPIPQPTEAVVPIPPPAPPAMTLAELESIAERNNPTLSQAAARVQALQGEWTQAGLYPNPRVGYQAMEIGDEGQAGQQGAFFGQEIVTAGKLKRSQNVAYQALQQAQWSCAAQRARVQNDVRHAFYDVLVAQRSVELTDQLVRIGQEGVRAADALLQAKEVSRVDVLQARIEADSAFILAEKARYRHQAAWRNLAVVVGAADMQPAPLAGDLQDGLPQLAWNDAVQRLLSESPVLAEARSGIARAEASLSRQCAERVPNVDLQAGALYDNATSDRIAEVQVGVPLPVFNRNQGNIRKAQAELAAARCDVQRVALELQQRLAGTFEQYQNARCQVEKYAGQILPNAQASLELVTAGYRQGEFNYVTLLTAQRTFFQVNLAYVDAIRELRSAGVAIEGNLLGDSLQQR